MVNLYRASVLVALVGLAVALGWKPLAAWNGFWAHAAVGREIADHGIPRHTLFLWTADIPWVYHSWLSDLAFFGVTRLPGFPYLVAGLTVALAAAPYAGVLAVWARRARDSWWVAVPVALVLQGVAVRFEPRPELFTSLSLFALLMFLTRWWEVETPRPWWLAAVLVGFALWANLHGAVVLGLVLLASTAACDLVQDRGSRKSRRLAVLAALAPLAVCANPYGLEYWRAFRPVQDEAFRVYLEWAPVYEGPPLPRESQVAAGVATALAVLGWVFGGRRRVAELAWLLVLGGLFLAQRRNIWPYTIACLAVAALNAGGIDTRAWWDRLNRGRQADEEPPARFRWFARLCVLAWLVAQASDSARGMTRLGPMTPVDLDRGAVAFLREHRGRLHGHLLNDQEASGYLEWCLPDGPRLYIDRMDAFPPEVMRRYLAVIGSRPESKELIAEVDVVVFTVDRPGQPLVVPARNLDRSNNWARVYAGPDAVVWVRRSKHPDLIAACPDVSRVDFAALVNHPAAGRPGPANSPGRPSSDTPAAIP